MRVRDNKENLIFSKGIEVLLVSSKFTYVLANTVDIISRVQASQR